MTIYFIRPIDQIDRIKVGFTDNMPERLQALSSEFENGIELLAQCEGGTEVESVFHSLLSDDWIEGEWFRHSPAAEAIIKPLSASVSGKRLWGRLRAVKDVPISPMDEDKAIARALMQTLMGRFGAIGFGPAQTKSHQVLAEINPMWTRRRVRAIWEQRSRRIDAYEIRDLNAAIESQSMDAHRRASAPLGRMDIPRSEG